MCPFRTRRLNGKCADKYFAFTALDLHDTMFQFWPSTAADQLKQLERPTCGVTTSDILDVITTSDLPLASSTLEMIKLGMIGMPCVVYLFFGQCFTDFMDFAKNLPKPTN